MNLSLVLRSSPNKTVNEHLVQKKKKKREEEKRKKRKKLRLSKFTPNSCSRPLLGPRFVLVELCILQREMFERKQSFYFWLQREVNIVFVFFAPKTETKTFWEGDEYSHRY